MNKQLHQEQVLDLLIRKMDHQEKYGIINPKRLFRFKR